MKSRRLKAVALSFLTACTSAPRSQLTGAPPDLARDLPPNTHWHEVVELESGPAPGGPVRISREAFEKQLVGALSHLPEEAVPGEWAREEFGVEGEVNLVAEVHHGKVYSLLVVDEHSPLEPKADAAMRERYRSHCTQFHKGQGEDCLALLKEGGPYLGAADRRALALDIAIHQVLNKSMDALLRELDVTKFIAGIVWMGALYLALWLAPDPTVTKALAGAISVVLVGWLGVKGLYDLVDTYLDMAHRAHVARTYEELEAAGERFATVAGDETIRVLILAVTKLTARTAGKVPMPVSQQVKELPGYEAAALRWKAQGGQVALEQAAVQVKWVSLSPTGGLAMAMAAKGARTISVPGYGTGIIAVRHQGGNIQVILPNGQRWHLPPGKTLKDIPTSDPLGDKLQEAATRWARQWGPHELTRNEAKAIDEARQAGEYIKAWVLERMARGRWVEAKVKKEFLHLKWNSTGVDVTGPNGYHYELLSGTNFNLEMHGRRMWDVFFRMISF